MTEKEKRERQKLQKNFGEHLRQIRKAKGISAAELAKRCFMEGSNIARIEMGRMNPSLYVLKKLCEGLEIKISELLKDFD